MTVDTSRWYEPLAPGTGKARSVGWWSMLLAGVALLLFQSTLVAAYVYIRWGHSTWPPEGFDTPSPAGLVPVVIPVAAAVAMSWAVRRLRQGSDTAPRLALLVTMGLGALAAAVRILAYADVGFRWDEEAYASLFWVLGGYEITILVLGTVMTAAVLLQALKGLHSSAHSAVLEVAALYWWFAAVTSALSIGTLYLGPYL